MQVLITTEEFKLALFPLLHSQESYYQQCIRTLLGNQDLILRKKPSGQPYLVDNEWNVSLSHCRDFLAVAVCKRFIPGVDIEDIRDSVLRIASRVFSPFELSFIHSMPPLEACHILWGVKEALYKSYGERGLIFIRDLRVKPFVFSNKGGSLEAELLNSHIYTLRYIFLPSGKVLVYTESVRPISPA